MASQILERIVQFTSIRPVSRRVDRWQADVLHRVLEAGIDPRVTSSLIAHIEGRLARWKNCLSNSRPTILHNDYQMQNILFPTAEGDRALYVIDWSRPRVGSVWMDMAMLLHTAPEEMQDPLVARYRSRVPDAGPAEGLVIARANVDLTVLAVTLTSILQGNLDGEVEAARRARCGTLIERLGERDRPTEEP